MKVKTKVSLDDYVLKICYVFPVEIRKPFYSFYLLDIHRTQVSWRYACTIPKGELEHSDI